MLNRFLHSITPDTFWWINQSYCKRLFTNPEYVPNHQLDEWNLIVSETFQPRCLRPFRAKDWLIFDTMPLSTMDRSQRGLQERPFSVWQHLHSLWGKWLTSPSTKCMLLKDGKDACLYVQHPKAALRWMKAADLTTHHRSFVTSGDKTKLSLDKLEWWMEVPKLKDGKR